VAAASAPTSRGRGDPIAAAGDGLTALGLTLVLLAVWRAGRTLELIPDVAASWWPAVLFVTAAYLASRARRRAAIGVAVAGGVLLALGAMPPDLVGPTLLIGLGVLVLAGASTRHRILAGWLDGDAVAVLGDRAERLLAGAAAPPVAALFGDMEAELEGPLADDDTLTCVALFGTVTVTVPPSVRVDVSPVAVFGDVRPPDPPRGPVTGTVRIRPTAVFGDVRIRRR
jgi:hypothetical protein